MCVLSAQNCLRPSPSCLLKGTELLKRPATLSGGKPDFVQGLPVFWLTEPAVILNSEHSPAMRLLLDAYHSC